MTALPPEQCAEGAANVLYASYQANCCPIASAKRRLRFCTFLSAYCCNSAILWGVGKEGFPSLERSTLSGLLSLTKVVIPRNADVMHCLLALHNLICTVRPLER